MDGLRRKLSKLLLWEILHLISGRIRAPLLPPPPPSLSHASEATGLGFVCFVVINPCVLSANKLIWAFLFLFHKFSNFTPPPSTNARYLHHRRGSKRLFLQPHWSDRPRPLHCAWNRLWFWYSGGVWGGGGVNRNFNQKKKILTKDWSPSILIWFSAGDRVCDYQGQTLLWYWRY